MISSYGLPANSRKARLHRRMRPFAPVRTIMASRQSIVPSSSSLAAATRAWTRASSFRIPVSASSCSRLLSVAQDAQTATSFRSKNRSMKSRCRPSSLGGKPRDRTRSTYARRSSFTRPRKEASGIPASRRLRASTTRNAVMPLSFPGASDESEVGSSEFRKAWVMEPDIPRTVIRQSSGSAGAPPKWPFASASARNRSRSGCSPLRMASRKEGFNRFTSGFRRAGAGRGRREAGSPSRALPAEGFNPSPPRRRRFSAATGRGSPPPAGRGMR